MLSRSTPLCRLMLALVALLSAAPAAAIPLYTLSLLAQSFQAHAELAPDGNFAAVASNDQTGRVRRYDLVTTAQVDVIRADGAAVSGISNQGLAVTGSTFFDTRPFIWNNGVIAPVAGVRRTTGISADGLVISGFRDTGVSGQFEAIRLVGGVVTGLGDLDGGAFDSLANDLSPDGSAVVGRGTSSLGPEAFVFKDGVMSALSDLAGGVFSSEATAASTDGSVVVGTGTTAAGLEAFRWQNGVMTGLGRLPGASSSEALDVSGDGSIVVGRSGNAGFIWDEANGMRSLTEYLAGFGVDMTGWTLYSVTGISSDGRVLVGDATKVEPGIGCFGCSGAYAVIVPEPVTGMLLAIGLAGIATARRAVA